VKFPIFVTKQGLNVTEQFSLSYLPKSHTLRQFGGKERAFSAEQKSADCPKMIIPATREEIHRNRKTPPLKFISD
jgi:hypothetical protein